MLFDTKDEKVAKLERRIQDMEKKMDHNIGRMNDTLGALREIIIKLQTENTQLRSERDFLRERHKKMLKRVPVPDLAGEIHDKLVKPAAGKIRENADFVQMLVKEGFVELKEPIKKEIKREADPIKDLKETINNPAPRKGKTMDSLLELVSATGRIRADEAARKLGVHEVQIEEWSKILEDHDLVTIKKSLGKTELHKI